jgi:hypothetical protein
VGASYPADVLDGLADALSWWDGVELWLTQRGLAFQVTVLMLVLLPSCWGAARILDRGVGVVIGRLAQRHDADAGEVRQRR